MIPVYTPKIGKKELENASDAIKTGWVSSRGKYIQEFEEKFASYCNVKYGTSTMNGTSALHLALVSLGIKKGDEVIVPNFTMIATALAVHYTGATPVFIDAEESTYNLDVGKLEEKITEKTKAIIPVHIYGHPCEMDEISEIAKEHNLFVIEDSAEAHGAEYKNKKCGSFGDFGCFSFYGNKLITTGEGGMLLTNNKELYQKSQSLKDLAFGKKNRFIHEEIGFNYRMTNLQAAIGLGQLENIDCFLNIKRKNAKIYSNILKDVKGLIIPPEKPYVKNSYWMYAVRFEDEFGIKKEEVKKKLLEKEVDTREFFFPMNNQPIFINEKLQVKDEFPVSKKLFETGLYLPSGLDLKEKDINYVCDCIKEIKE